VVRNNTLSVTEPMPLGISDNVFVMFMLSEYVWLTGTHGERLPKGAG